MANIRFALVVLGATAAVSVAVACGSDDPSANENSTAVDAGPRGVEQAGQACTALGSATAASTAAPTAVR
jgi:hypothetical protein